MKMWNIWKGTVVLTLILGMSLLILTLGTSSFVPTARGAAEPINIGFLISYTGTLGWVGACQVGVEIAKDEINAAGGVLGRPIEIKIVDDESKSDAAIAGEEKLVNIDKVHAIIGLAVLPPPEPIRPFALISLKRFIRLNFFVGGGVQAGDVQGKSFTSLAATGNPVTSHSASTAFQKPILLMSGLVPRPLKIPYAFS